MSLSLKVSSPTNPEPMGPRQPPQDKAAAAAATSAPQAKGGDNALQRRNVYVSGLPETFRAAEFREMCQAFGRVEASKLCIDTKCRPMKGYGFALFFEEGAAAKCIKHLNGHWLGGRTLQARLADVAATPAPLDPVSAHPPISRARLSSKLHRTPNSSLHSTAGMTDGPLGLTKSIPLSPCSSRELTPPITPSQATVNSTLFPPSDVGSGSRYSDNGSIAAPSTQPIFYHQVAMEQQMAPPAASFPAQPGYLPMPPAFFQPPMMGMPVYVTMPPWANSPAGTPQPFVLPTTMMSPGGCPQQFYSPVVFSP
ncbi:putative RNA-binding protein [Trypanosoma conorhini]|uniref:Putative RNA-binding protein n=1 Tax=Trypanosoma conorhini TaxID=83891 RepID=A0A422P9J9_9TRYP|nr:putative RNA-binding protein [Trypanosoma conorhini]RNF14386.1 putative RNA-binding protein [Trypanosoma conorhini]